MATLKQKMAFSKITENNWNVTKTMREVGYASETCVKPKNLTDSKGWKELMDKYISEKALIKVHKEGLKATVKKPHLVDRDDKGRPIYEYTDEVDYSVRHKYLETGYKIRGRMAKDPEDDVPPVNINIINILEKTYGEGTIREMSDNS